MLINMYKGWGRRKGFSVEQLAEFTLRLGGNFAYGWTRTETGVHRLIRISPFSALDKRHTSFASVSVLPVPPSHDTAHQLVPAELRIDTFRSSGAGGQSVNKTESAVRITHVPTGLVVSCQNERSQHQNKRTAMLLLQARLLAAAESRHAEVKGDLRNALGRNAWGEQIRSVVLQPYKMVKDSRTQVSSADTDGYLAGNLDLFVEAALRLDVSHASDQAVAALVV
jgi:peptide chain release factor 2